MEQRLQRLDKVCRKVDLTSLGVDRPNRTRLLLVIGLWLELATADDVDGKVPVPFSELPNCIATATARDDDCSAVRDRNPVT
jgi:hypothetical protein